MLERKIFLGLLLIITIWGGLLRFHNLGSQSLWIDEGYSIQAAQAIEKIGSPTFANGKIYNNHFLHSYLIAGSFVLFDFDSYNPWAARLPAALFGTLLIPLSYLLCFLLFKKHSFAFVSALIVTFFTLEIAWSRQARGYTPEQFFNLLSFVFLWIFIEKRKIIFALLTSVSIVIASLFHLLSIVFVPVILLFYILYKFLEKKPFQKQDLFLLIPILAVLYFGITKNIDHQLALTYYIKFLFTDWLFITILSSLGIILGFFKKEFRNQIVFLIIGIFIPLIIFSIKAPIAHVRYLIILFPFFAILISFSIHTLFNLILKDDKDILIRSLLPPAMILIFLSSHLNFSTKEEYNLSFDTPQSDFKSSYEFLRNNLVDEDILITAHPHMTQLYLDKIGLWIPFSLSGKASETLWSARDNKERVTGAPTINSQEELAQIMSSGHGYILLDQLMVKRKIEISRFIAENNTKLVFHSIKPIGEIWIFEFGL